MYKVFYVKFYFSTSKMISSHLYLLHQAVFRLHFPVKCLLPIWPIDHSMLMDYAIFPIFTLMRTWSLVSSLNFYFSINPALQMIILINKALIEHLLRVWIRTQSLVRVKCFQSDRNQTFKTCSSSYSYFIYNILLTVTPAPIYHSTHWVPAQYAAEHTRKVLALSS